MKALLCALSWCFLSGCAHWTNYGQVADVSTTMAGLSQGFVEANPLLTHPAAMAVGVAIKLSLPSVARRQPPKLCYTLRQSSAAIGWGAAIANLLVIGGVVASLPVSLGIAGLVGVVVYAVGEPSNRKACQFFG